MKKLTALVLGALLLIAAPVVYGGGDDRGKGGHDDDKGDRDDRGKDKRSLDVIGLTADGRLIEFEEDDPRDADTIGKVSGLNTDTKLVGIDYRPANGSLYGLGDQGGVYTLNTDSAAATLVSRLNVALAGQSFGVDFNPVVDRLRVISDTGQNLRVNVADGVTLTDGTLSYTPPAAATGVTGAAYTNNDADPTTATTLFDIDSVLDQVAIQSPANSGQLVATGKLGVDTGAATGSDIYSTIRSGTTVDLTALAALTVDGASRFYSVNLLIGRVSPRGTFSSKNQITGIAIPLNQL